MIGYPLSQYADRHYQGFGKGIAAVRHGRVHLIFYIEKRNCQHRSLNHFLEKSIGMNTELLVGTFSDGIFFKDSE